MNTACIAIPGVRGSVFSLALQSHVQHVALQDVRCDQGQQKLVLWLLLKRKRGEQRQTEISCIHVGLNQNSCGISSNSLTSLLVSLPRGSLLVSFVPLLGTQIHAQQGNVCSKQWHRKKLTPTKSKVVSFCPDRTKCPFRSFSPPPVVVPLLPALPFWARLGCSTDSHRKGVVGHADGLETGRTKEQQDFFNMSFPAFGYPYGLAWCHLKQLAALGCGGLAELAARAWRQFVWLVGLRTAFLAG